MQFFKQVRRTGIKSLVITIPRDLVIAYDIHDGDFLEFELIKNHRDKIKNG